MWLQWAGQVRLTDELLATDIRDLVAVSFGTDTVLVSTTGKNGGLASFDLASGQVGRLSDTL